MTRYFIVMLFCMSLPATALASGNHPEAGACPQEKPYYAICTHSLHNLEGWYSRECQTTRAEAEKDVQAHADKWHKGNTRWTGVARTR